MKEPEYDIVAIGGGTAGLVAAAGAAYLGARPGLVEKDALGGDCLWTGCVPSKALLASGRLAQAMGRADALGLTPASPAHAFRRVMARMRRAREKIAHHDDPERFREMGVGVHFGAARFLSPDTVEVEGVGRIRSKRFVVATGATPAVPPCRGLEETGFLTHVTALEEDELPGEIAILGAGPIGLEFAQIYSRLGARVTVVEMAPEVLPAEDPEAAAALRGMLEEEGIRVLTGFRADEAEASGERKTVIASDGRRVECDEILVATGRRPHTGGLELQRAGVERDGAAVRVDRSLRTTAPTVWAAGDVTGGPQYTHRADRMARTVVRNALFPFSSKLDDAGIPRVTYTDPELAHVGMAREEAESRGGTTHTYDLSDLDRAIVDGTDRGFVRVTADRKGRVLGATILGHGAGELLQPLVLAVEHDLTLSDLANTVFPYPTMMEGVKRAADAYQRSRLDGLGGRILRKVVSWLA